MKTTDRLTIDADFCDISLCLEERGGECCPDGYCSQRRVWERLKAYEDSGLTPTEVRTLKERYDLTRAELDVTNKRRFELEQAVGQAYAELDKIVVVKKR